LALQLLGTNVIRKEVELGQVEFDLQVPWQAQEQGTPDAMGADASLGTLFILLAVLQLHASQPGISGTARRAGADSNRVLYRAATLSSTGIGQGTGIDALRVQAGLLPRAVVIVRALDLGSRCQTSITEWKTASSSLEILCNHWR